MLPIHSSGKIRAIAVENKIANEIRKRITTTSRTKSMLRIVSLIASASEIVASLGLSRYQVGRSHECDFPAEILTLPICTSPAFPTDGSSAEIDRRVKERVANALSVYEVSRDILDALQPTHVITQTQCRVCAVSLEDVERALRVG